MRNRHLYPENWEAIAFEVKEEALWNCEHCGRPCRQPGETIEHFTDRIADSDPNEIFWMTELYEEVGEDEEGLPIYVFKPQRFTLTVSHKDHTPQNCDRQNLQALCAPCHLRYDAQHHARSASSTRYKKREKAGQLTLFTFTEEICST